MPSFALMSVPFYGLAVQHPSLGKNERFPYYSKSSCHSESNCYTEQLGTWKVALYGADLKEV